MYLFKVCVVFFGLACAGESARILGIFHLPTYSHFQLGDRIFRELAARGHKVTVISPYELKTPVKNLEHVVITGFKEDFEEFQQKLFNQDSVSIPQLMIMMDMMGNQFTETVFNSTNVQNLLKSNEKFDLVIHELFFNEAFAAFPLYYNTPSIVINTQGASEWTDTMMGNPHNPSYTAELVTEYSKDMNLSQRTLNTIIYVALRLLKHFRTIPNQNRLLQKYFPGSPHLSKIYNNVSLMLLNSHVSMDEPGHLLQNMIPIGGYHIQPDTSLPKDLQDYLDTAKNGVVLFSMGSNLKSKHMPEHKRNDILKALSKLKQDVLWKWEDDVLPGQPPNVRLVKWLPQQAILAHPNIKLFITHGGLLSTIEAVYYGVPVLGLSVYGDQKHNMATAERNGYGICLPFKNLDEASLSSALHELLNNPKYAETVKQKSKLMLDQPQKPLETAIYWIEYVLRHHGAPHLKTSGLHLQWYQYLLLDVAAIVILSVTTILYVLYKTILFVCVCGTRSKRINKNKKKN